MEQENKKLESVTYSMKIRIFDYITLMKENNIILH